MNISKSLLVLAAFLLIVSANIGFIIETHTYVPYRKGLTYQAKVWPAQSNYWTGQMGCVGCDPVNGDT